MLSIMHNTYIAIQKFTQSFIDSDSTFKTDTWFSNSHMDDLLASHANTWQTDAYRQLKETVQQSKFPCLFAQRSLKNQSQSFAFIDPSDQKELARLNAIFSNYASDIKEKRSKGQYLQPLLVMIKPDDSDKHLQDHREKAWTMLQALHDHDTAPWPTEIPKDPNHKDWSFCHSGEQLFINISSPFHEEHHARNLGSSLTFVVNPRKNFDIVAPRGAQGERVRALIQEKARVYEHRSAATPVAFYGDKGHLEWKMYALEESQAPLPKICPLNLKKIEYLKKTE